MEEDGPSKAEPCSPGTGDNKRHRCYLFAHQGTGEPYRECRDKIRFLIWNKSQGLVQWKNAMTWNAANNKGSKEEIIRATTLAKETRIFARCVKDIRVFGEMPEGMGDSLRKAISEEGLHSTPLHSTPLHSTPLHSTPLRIESPGSDVTSVDLIPLKEEKRRCCYSWNKPYTGDGIPFSAHGENVRFVIWKRKDDVVQGWISWKDPVSRKALESKEEGLKDIRPEEWNTARVRFGPSAKYNGKYPGSAKEKETFDSIRRYAKGDTDYLAEDISTDCEF